MTQAAVIGINLEVEAMLDKAIGIRPREGRDLLHPVSVFEAITLRHHWTRNDHPPLND